MGLHLSSTVEYFSINCNLVIVCCSAVGAGTLDLKSPMIVCSGLLKATHGIKAGQLGHMEAPYMLLYV